jgi:hypothetical protein
MPQRHVVVDGSNIATEGRSLPSLAQLDQAVREFLGEFPDDIVTVVVDASFAHRIDPSEVGTFEEAEAAGEVVSPPAGAIGRGDAFLLRIADKTGATVLSNDSFQEFHGEHEWLFDPDRLIGGKPVPGVGWIFTPRTPVRGPKSREAVKEAKRKKRAESDDGKASGLDLAASRGRGRGKKVERAIATATEEAVEPSDTKKRRRRKNSEPPSDPINEPLAFITFIAGHPLGSEVEGTVDSFASHGAFVDADGARCYVPLSAMGDPAPRSAREVMSRGETRPFVIQALDPLRRGIELALPGFAKLSGAPTDETVEAETHPVAGDQAEPSTGAAAVPAKRAGARRRPAVAPPLAEGEDRGDRPAIGASKAAPPARRRSRSPAAAAGGAPPAEPPPTLAAPVPAPGPATAPGDAPVPAGRGQVEVAEAPVPRPTDKLRAKTASRRGSASKASSPEPVAAEASPAGTAVTGNATVGPEPARKSAATRRRARKEAPPGAGPGPIDQEPAGQPQPEGGAPAKRKAPAKKAPSRPVVIDEAPGEPAGPRKATGRAATKKVPGARESGRKAASGRAAGAPRTAKSPGVLPAAESAGPAPPKANPTGAPTKAAPTEAAVTKVATKAAVTKAATKKMATKAAKKMATKATKKMATKATKKMATKATKKMATKATKTPTKTPTERVTPQRSGPPGKASAKRAGGSRPGERS